VRGGGGTLFTLPPGLQAPACHWCAHAPPTACCRMHVQLPSWAAHPRPSGLGARTPNRLAGSHQLGSHPTPHRPWPPLPTAGSAEGDTSRMQLGTSHPLRDLSEAGCSEISDYHSVGGGVSGGGDGLTSHRSLGRAVGPGSPRAQPGEAGGAWAAIPEHGSVQEGDVVLVDGTAAAAPAGEAAAAAPAAGSPGAKEGQAAVRVDARAGEEPQPACGCACVIS